MLEVITAVSMLIPSEPADLASHIDELIPLQTPVERVIDAQAPLDPHEEQRIILEAAQEAEDVLAAEQAAAEEAARAEREAQEAQEALDAEPAPAVRADAPSARSVWDDLADCESGNWVNGGASFETGSARWAWGGADPIPPWGTSVHDGGLQFHPDTWTWLKPDGYPARAYDATREQQIAVAERVLERQGWGAWPVCSQKLGLR